MESAEEKNIKELHLLHWDDVNMRHGKSSGALNNMDKIWKSNLLDNLKRIFLEEQLNLSLHMAQPQGPWHQIGEKVRKKMHSTCMLWAALNKTCRQHLTNKVPYDTIPPLSKSICQHRLRFAGHCWRSKNELACEFWIPLPILGTPNEHPQSRLTLINWLAILGA